MFPNPTVEAGAVTRVGYIIPAAIRPAAHLLRGGKRSFRVGFQRSPSLIELLIEKKIKLDHHVVRSLIDERLRPCLAGTVAAKQGIGHRVEDRRLAAAVRASQHPERSAVECNLLLVAV